MKLCDLWKSFLSLFLVTLTVLGQSDAPDTFYAVQTHFGQYYRADMDSASVVRMLDLLAEAGIRTIRDECYWSLVEQDSGVFVFPKEIDHYIQAAGERGIQVLLILDYNNTLYDDGSSAVTTERNRAAYARYCREVVRHYAPMGVRYYEIWNEPNLPMFWSPTPDADDYLELLKAAYPAIKVVDSTVTVLGCAAAPLEGEQPPNIEGLDFIQRVFAGGGADYMDAVSFHLYRVWQAPEEWIFSYPAAVQNRVNGMPMYLSEFGYHSASVWPNMSDDTKAEYLARAYLLGRSTPNLQMMCCYDLKDDGQDGSHYEHRYGLLNFAMNPKKSFLAYRKVVQMTADKELLLMERDGSCFHSMFAAGTDTVVAAWSNSGMQTASCPVPQGRLALAGMLGDTLKYLINRDGSMEIGRGTTPRWIYPIANFPPIADLHLYPEMQTLVMGQNIDFRLEAVAQDGIEIRIDDGTCVDWSFSNEFAYIDSGGQLTTAWKGTGILRAQFEGCLIEKQLRIIPPYETLELESFDCRDSLTVSFSGLDSATQIAIVDTNFSTASQALALNYELSYRSKIGHKFYLEKEYELPGEPDSLFIDVYNNGNPHYFKFYFEDVDGKRFILRTDPLAMASGWQTAGAAFHDMGTEYFYPLRLTRVLMYIVQQDGVSGTVYNGTVLLDNLGVHAVPAATEIRSSAQPQNLDFCLDPSFPNPFNASITIRFRLPYDMRIFLQVFDARGHRVKTLVAGRRSGGEHEILFDASELPTGIYFVRLNNENYSQIQKVLLLK